MTVVLCSDHFYNCPICGKPCKEQKDGSNYVLRMHGPYQQFLCNTPLAEDPLHYYSHMVHKPEPNKVAYQEFSLDLGSKTILFANNYIAQTTMIKQSHDANFLELNFIISPDFPYLNGLKKKVRTAITFS